MQEETNKKHLLELREDEKKPPFWTKERKKAVIGWVVPILVAVIVALLIKTFLFFVTRVDGSSMAETLHSGDVLIATVPDVKINGAQKGDIVICKYPDRGNTLFVKRVVATEGDTIAIKGGVTYVNGEAIEEDFVTHPTKNSYSEVTVPENCVFVCGDNRANSHDSRSSDVGFIEESMIVGKAHFVFWPIGEARSLS